MSKPNPKLTLSFDIGHSSIGWAILSPTRPHPEILGCGSVMFPKNDCLASARRTHRRARRNIRSKRQRISRIKKLLCHLGIATELDLDAPGHPAPHVLAASSLLAPEATLSWLEIWHVLRWYAHNRGYDGNARWARHSENEEDTEKEIAAKKLMLDHGTNTMAETICAELGIHPTKSKNISSARPFKNYNAAFPRAIIRAEVVALLEKHKGHLTRLDDDFIECLIQQTKDSDNSGWQRIPVPNLTLPKRYQGGLLFGQLVPRFDNRIITICPISGQKVPNKDSKEFLEYRWAMLLANIRAEGKPLSPEQRQSIHNLMVQKGKLTPTDLRLAIEKITGTKNNNIKLSFEIHPDSKDALELDPSTAYFQKAFELPAKKGGFGLHLFWPHLPEPARNRGLGRWRKGRPVNLAWMLDQCSKENFDVKPLQNAVHAALAEDEKKKKPSFLTLDHLLNRPFIPETPTGRAPYARPVLQEVVNFVLTTNRHPTEVGGPIYRSPEVLQKERSRSIFDLTNNHLIRQRLTILLRLTDDILKQYAENQPSRITDIVIEVARDLQQYSGLTSKEMASALTKRLTHFKAAVKYLESNAPDLPLTGSLIRKCRIAMDLDWTCPFTGKRYDPYTLSQLEREHIIPYADRPTNALDAQVLTFDWVNKLKAKRTALRFIQDISEDNRFLSPKKYRDFVDDLKVAKKETYPEDNHRQMARKKWLLLETYEAKEQGFTEGALTQTSHLNRLAARRLERRFIDPITGDCTAEIHALPGQVTAEARKAWKLLGTLVPACQECKDKTKTEIREITHLHHALDASTIGLIAHYLPGNVPSQHKNEKGSIWKAMLQRHKTSDEIFLLMQTGIFQRSERLDQKGEVRRDAKLVDLPDKLKKQIINRLSECRVVQHIPSDRSGALLEQNPWRVRFTSATHAIITQVSGEGASDASISKSFNPQSGAVVRQRNKQMTAENLKEVEELVTECGRAKFRKHELNLLNKGVFKIKKVRHSRLVGLQRGKLAKNNSVLIISENYGLALGNSPQLIPHHSVPEKLARILEINGNKFPDILRIGTLIHVPRGTWQGTWRITSLKDSQAYGLSVDLAAPDGCKMTRGNAKVPDMLNDGLKILRPPLTGTDLTQIRPHAPTQ